MSFRLENEYSLSFDLNLLTLLALNTLNELMLFNRLAVFFIAGNGAKDFD